MMMSFYLCNDGNAEVEICAESARAAAQEYVDDGDWGEIDETDWVEVYVQEVSNNREEIGERMCITIAIEPEAPDCSDETAVHPDCIRENGHDWHSPYEVVGGITSNPGVWCNGGGVVIKEVCADCGVYRITDTWAQNRTTGEQGLRSVMYEEADKISLKWIRSLEDSVWQRIEWDVLTGVDGECLITGETKDGRSVTFTVTPDGIDYDRTDGDEYNDGWPDPPTECITEAMEQASATVGDNDAS